jgi:hypothetical protein
MKITKTDVFWWVVIALAFVVIVSGCLAMVIKSDGPAYDEQGHRAEISKIYPSVRWPEYRDAARQICDLDDNRYRLVEAMAEDDSPEAAQAFVINSSYLCPGRS